MNQLIVKFSQKFKNVKSRLNIFRILVYQQKL